MKGGITHAISIRQPFVELILRGVKKREFRSGPTNLRERVYLYASIRPADWPEEWRRVGKRPGELPTAAILGSVEIVDCRWDERVEDWAYVLERPKRLARPRYVTNHPQPRFWLPRFK